MDYEFKDGKICGEKVVKIEEDVESLLKLKDTCIAEIERYTDLLADTSAKIKIARDAGFKSRREIQAEEKEKKVEEVK